MGLNPSTTPGASTPMPTPPKTLMDPFPFSLRTALPSDAPAITKLGAHIFTESFGHSVAPHHLRAYLDEFYSLPAITADLEDANKQTVVATATADAGSNDGPSSTDHVLGFALLTRSSSEPCVAHLEKTIELQRIYVSAKSRGKGLGKALAREVERIAREAGFRHMWLGVWEENVKAQKLYKRLGYRVLGDHDFDVGGVVQKDLVMAKEL